jgi:SAM-dependent methyltransferase
MFEQVSPWLGQKVMEAGAGIGTYSSMAWKAGKTVTALELSDNYFTLLEKRFAGQERITTLHGSITDSAITGPLETEGMDSIFSLNVLEHIPDDQQALRNFRSILRPGGKIVVLVPAHRWLYNSLDKELGHVRRYTKKELREKVEAAGFKIHKLYFWNSLAMLGWFVNGNVLKKEKVAPGAARLFDQLVPVLKFTEKNILRGALGISLIVVAEKI